MLDGLWCILKRFFYMILETIIQVFDYLLSMIADFLPDTPFEFQTIEWGVFGNSIGYFIPIQTILQHMIILLSSIAIYYAVRNTLRLIRVIK